MWISGLNRAAVWVEKHLLFSCELESDLLIRRVNYDYERAFNQQSA